MGGVGGVVVLWLNWPYWSGRGGGGASGTGEMKGAGETTGGVEGGVTDLELSSPTTMGAFVVRHAHW